MDSASRVRRGRVGRVVTVFLCGDVMPARGIDQILPHPGDPALREPCVDDARTYVGLAESVNGRIPRPVDFAWPWGDSLQLLDDVAPDVRIVNLETSITRSAEFAPNKGVHYRMSPDNVACLAVLRPSACALANNHVLDFGRAGLVDTLDALSRAGLVAVGAGRDARGAQQPAVIPLASGGRVLVLACGLGSSGIPQSWAAAADRPGVYFLPALTDKVATDLTDQVSLMRRTGDVVVVSIHWGSNWGYDVHPDQRRFAHRLIDGGVDIVHGHSSHHPRPIETYRGKLVLYGCGDFVNDYEGISGHAEFRDDLRLMYFASVHQDTGELAELRMAVMHARRLRLEHASRADSEWLHAALGRVSDHFGTHIELLDDGRLALRAE